MRNATNRRTFLGATAALTLASGVRLRAAGRTAPGELRLGVASYSLRKFPRDKAIEMLKELEVRRVSIKSFHLPYEGSPEETKSGAQEFRDAGIEVLSGGNIDLTDPSKLRDMFEYAKNAGLPMMVCAPSPETLDAVEKLAREYNIKIAIHNHGPEDKRFPSSFRARACSRRSMVVTGGWVCASISDTRPARATTSSNRFAEPALACSMFTSRTCET